MKTIFTLIILLGLTLPSMAAVSGTGGGGGSGVIPTNYPVLVTGTLVISNAHPGMLAGFNEEGVLVPYRPEGRLGTVNTNLVYAFDDTNIVVYTTNNIIVDLAFDRVFIHMLTNCNMVIFSNSAAIDNDIYIYFQQDTNGSRDVVHWAVDGGIVETNVSLSLTLTATPNYYDLMHVRRGFFPTNVNLTWSYPQGVVGVKDASIYPVASFLPGPTNGLAPLTVYFTNYSTGRDISYIWYFDAGGDQTLTNYSSAAVNPFTYTNPGTYSVQMQVSNVYGGMVYQNFDVITVTNLVPYISAITANSTNNSTNAPIEFAVTALGPSLEYHWRFQHTNEIYDPVYFTNNNPTTWLFTNQGTYSVSCVASNSYGTNMLVKHGFVGITNIVAEAPAYYYPTNLPAQPATDWWVADDYTTNGANVELTGRWAGIVSTNLAGTQAPRGKSADIGDKRSLEFVGGQVMRTYGISNAQPFTLFTVMQFTNAGSAGYFADTTDSQFTVFRGTLDVNHIRVYGGGSSQEIGPTYSNTWWSVTITMDGANTKVYTNGVASLGANVGANGMTNLFVGFAGGNWFTGKIGTWAVYPSALTAQNVSNLWVWSTNYYGSTTFNRFTP